MDRLKNVVTLLVANFGPLLGFYFINHFYGFKPAVAVSMSIVFLEFLWLKLSEAEITDFFYFSSFIILAFGAGDLFIDGPYFMKFEAFATNLIFAVFFGISLFKEKSIVQEIAESQKRTGTDNSPDKKYFFQVLTLLWCVYLVVKAVFYLWLNLTTSLEEAFLARMIIGKVSFWVMMFISIAMPKKIWKAMEFFKLFPSQRLVSGTAATPLTGLQPK